MADISNKCKTVYLSKNKFTVLSLEFASFLYNIEKGEGGLVLNINRI